MRALCEAVAVLLSKNMTCARPRCNATPSEDFLHTSTSHSVLFTLYSSHPALHTSHLHFTLHTSSHLKSCELFSPHLSSSHLIPSLLTTCHLSKFFSTVFITDQPFSSRSSSQLISAVLHARNLLLSERSLLPKKTIGRRNFCTQKLETQMHLHRKAFTNYFVLPTLHKALPSITLY